MPDRIQLRRVRGWRMPTGTLIVDRRTKWGNNYAVRESQEYPGWWIIARREGPFERPLVPRIATKEQAAREAVEMFESDLRHGYLQVTEEDVKRELRGKTLACWCRVGSPCHGDALLRIANEVEGG